VTSRFLRAALPVSLGVAPGISMASKTPVVVSSMILSDSPRDWAFAGCCWKTCVAYLLRAGRMASRGLLLPMCVDDYSMWGFRQPSVFSTQPIMAFPNDACGCSWWAFGPAIHRRSRAPLTPRRLALRTAPKKSRGSHWERLWQRCPRSPDMKFNDQAANWQPILRASRLAGALKVQGNMKSRDPADTGVTSKVLS
jgi:hypothetical protein